MIELLKKLCSLYGVAGNEEEVRDFIVEKAREFGGEVTIDPIGDVLVLKKGKKERQDPVMLLAHMDEAGFKVTNVRDDGTGEIQQVGETDPISWIGTRVVVGKDKVPGCFCMPGRKRYASQTFIPAPGDILLDVGPKTAGEASKFMHKNDGVCFKSEWRDMPHGLVKGRAFDSRIGCAILLSLLKEELEYDTWFAFTCRDSIKARGAGRGAQVAMRNVMPKQIAIVESREAYDFASVPAFCRNLTLGAGCGVVLAENRSTYSRPLREHMTKAASEKGIKWQYTTRQGSDLPTAREAQTAAGGAYTICFAVPVRYLKTPNPVAQTADINAALDMCRLFAEETEARND